MSFLELIQLVFITKSKDIHTTGFFKCVNFTNNDLTRPFEHHSINDTIDTGTRHPSCFVGYYTKTHFRTVILLAKVFCHLLYKHG